MRLTLFSFFVVALFSLTSCATSPESKIPPAGVLPVGQTFRGMWYSQVFQHMYLFQVGNHVTGIYTYKNGGQIDGTVSGNLLVFRWHEPGDIDRAHQAFTGHGYLFLTGTGDHAVLNGKWGYEDNYEGGGDWHAEFVRPIEDGDPTSLDSWRKNGMQP